MSTISSNIWNILHWSLYMLGFSTIIPLMIFKFWCKSIMTTARSRLVGKVVLITGASSGLGEALAHIFYKAGCKIIISARRLEELERVKHDLLNTEVKVGPVYPPTILLLDLANLNEIPRYASEAISIYNGIDILINNGGISVRANAINTALDVDLKVMNVNYFGAVALTKAVLPSMVCRQKGHILFISSVQGKVALPHRSAYSASKHALQAFSDSLRAEISAKSIKVTCISPGYIRTQLSINALTSSGEKYGKMDTSTAQGMPPEDCAKRIFEALLRNDKDLMICGIQPKIAYLLRFCIPSVYYWIMEKRALRLDQDVN